MAGSTPSMDSAAAPTVPYRVLARTYRPTRLSELIGQDGLVRTLTNAFKTGRIAHAFLLAGIRGVGKTTTARIIARGLNCTGADGRGGPTPEPCGRCPSCEAIATDRSIDVIELDAATRTGIDDIREIVGTVAYAPSSSRYKVYIIDEVHMLSRPAFNGLLKTLEEPPAHVKFVFATTELAKIPVTVLSRCQRFDLRRVAPDVLAANLERICGLEAVRIEPTACALLAAAADGSVRDSISLLDQAIALSEDGVDAATVQGMLGLADRGRTLDLWEAVSRGDTGEVIDLFAGLYDLGVEPAALIADLLVITHTLSRLKARGGSSAGADRAATGQGAGPGQDGEDGRLAGLALASSLPLLARAWQMLLKGIEEVRAAPDPAAAAEMVLLRLACVADLPPPAELARLARGEAVPVPQRPGTAPSRAEVPAPVASLPSQPVRQAAPEPAPPADTLDQAEALQAVKPAPSLQAPITDEPPTSFAALLGRIELDDGFLAAWLREQARIIRFEPGRIEFEPAGFMPPDLPSRLASAAQATTGRRWMVALGRGGAGPTLAQASRERAASRLAQLEHDPSIREVLDAFPGAKLVEVRGDGERDDRQRAVSSNLQEGKQTG